MVHVQPSVPKVAISDQVLVLKNTMDARSPFCCSFGAFIFIIDPAEVPMKTQNLRSLTLHLANQELVNFPCEVAWGHRKHDSGKVEGFERHRQGPAGG